MRLRNIPGSNETISNHPAVFDTLEGLKGEWHNIFGNTSPIYTEIGMGKGRFIMDLARLHPENNYIGIEKYSSVLIRALEKYDEEPLDNLRFIRMDAEDLLEAFSENEITGIYLNFSDPWPKDRHYKRRLTYRGKLDRYAAVMIPEGRLIFKTDNVDLFDFSLTEVDENGWTLEKMSRDLHHSQYAAGNIMTEYEAKFSSMGNPIHMLTAYKKSK